MEKIAFIFPGQGAQFVGMGKDFYDNFSISKKVYDKANDILGVDIKDICFEGPNEELIKTENTQPAILATSIAMASALKEKGINCDCTAGLSLGEYSALVEAEALDFKEALPLVKKRGKYMQEAVPLGKGKMAAILGLDREKVKEAINRVQNYGVVEISNYNSPGQIVISGEAEAVELAAQEASELGAKKVVFLPVSAPFHCSLLKPAGEKLKKDLNNIVINDLKKAVVANVDAKPLVNKDNVKPNLVRQVSNSVLWCDSVNTMLDNKVDTFIEIGPGKSLTGFVKKTAKARNIEVNTFTVNNIEGFNKVCDFFSKEA